MYYFSVAIELVDKFVITTDVDRVLFTTVPAEIAARRADRIVCDFVTAWIIHTRYIHEKRNIRGLSQSIYDTRINLFGRRRSAFYFLPLESCETFPSCGSLINSLAVMEEAACYEIYNKFYHIRHYRIKIMIYSLQDIRIFFY